MFKNFGIIMMTSLVGSIGLISSSEVKFKYRYEVVSETRSVSDTTLLYRYKERLIDKFETLIFTLDEKYHNDYIKKNIVSFNDINAVASLKSGVIILKVGKGGGMTISGGLRKDACDTDVVREKFFIFELFD